jgi:uncharacterized membrane protein YphA (DoxX/SURF4 family)
MMNQTSTTPAGGSVGPDQARPGAQRRWGNVALWGLQVVVAGVFVMAAIPKLTADPQAVAGFSELGLGTAGMYVIGVLEIAGAIGLLIPPLVGLAGLALTALMVGAVISTLLTSAELVAIPAAVLVLTGIIAWGRRRRTAELIALVRSWIRS